LSEINTNKGKNCKSNTTNKLLKVAGYTGPLLLFFKRTYTHHVDNKGLATVPWRLRGLGRSNVRSDSLVKFVFCFVLLNRNWGIVTVPGSFIFRGPGVAGSSPSTVTTSLATPVPSSSSSNAPTTTNGGKMAKM